MKKIYKAKVKDFNSTAVTVTLPTKDDKEQDVIIFYKELNENGFLTPLTHPEIFKGNTLDINLHSNLSRKDRMYIGELENKYEITEIKNKLSKVKIDDYIYAVVNRIEKSTRLRYDDISQLKQIQNQIPNTYFNKLSLDSLIEKSIEEKKLNKELESEFNTFKNYLLLTQSSNSLVSILNTFIFRIIQDSKRIFATIVDDDMFGLEVGFFETDVKLNIGDTVITKVTGIKNKSIRGEMIALLTQKNNIYSIPTESTNKIFYLLNKSELENYSKIDLNKMFFLGEMSINKENVFCYVKKENFINFPNLYWRRIFFLELTPQNIKSKLNMLEKISGGKFNISFYKANIILEYKGYKFSIVNSGSIFANAKNKNLPSYQQSIEDKILFIIKDALK